MDKPITARSQSASSATLPLQLPNPTTYNPNTHTHTHTHTYTQASQNVPIRILLPIYVYNPTLPFFPSPTLSPPPTSPLSLFNPALLTQLSLPSVGLEVLG